MLTIDDWPAVEPTQILPGLWMGGLAEHEYLGAELTDEHYSFTSPFDLVVTLYADAQPAPWGVTELRYGLPDDDIPVLDPRATVTGARALLLSPATRAGRCPVLFEVTRAPSPAWK